MLEVSSPTTERTLNITDDTNTTGSRKIDEFDSTLAFKKGLPAREVHRRAHAACRLQGKAHYLLAQWLLEVEERKLHLELGHSSLYQYAELALHLEGHTVAEYLRTARALKNFPLLSRAYEEGSLSASKLREITRVVEKDTECYWLDMALTHTTRQVEKMVVFSPRQSRMGSVKAGEQSSSQHDFPQGDCFSEISATQHGSSTDHVLGPTVGLQGQLTLPFFQPDMPHGEDPGHLKGNGKVHELSSSLCCRENLMAPRTSFDSGYHEDHPLNDIPPRKYLEKMVLELSGEQAAIVHDAFRKARKESGMSDRASLVTYLARVFLDGVPESQVQQSKKPPYQVVLHHQSGITWTESERGPVYVQDAVCEKALCDGEIVELETVPDDCCRNKTEVDMKAEIQSPDHSNHRCDFAPARDNEFECVSPGESVNRLFQHYKNQARERNDSETGKPGTKHKPVKSSRRTIPLSLRKKVLLRDGGRCQAPGCGRTRFVEVHHVIPVGAGGGHTLENTVVLCSTCHAGAHEGRFFIEGEAPGRLRWRRM